MSSLMDEISRDVEEAPRLRVRVAQLEREVRSLRARNERLGAALHEADLIALKCAAASRRACPDASGLFGQVLRDMRGRAKVAEGLDGDATVHHSAVAAMLVDFAGRLEEQFAPFPVAVEIQAKIIEELRRECARLRQYDEASAREVDELRSRVVGPLLAIDLHEAGAMMRCYEFVRGVQYGAAQGKGAE